MNGTGGRKRARTTRVAALELAPSPLARVWSQLQRTDVLLRCAILLAASTVMWGVVHAWAPPFEYHIGFVPTRNITARVEFKQVDPRAIDADTKRFLMYEPGEALALAGQPLSEEAVQRLRAEHDAYVENSEKLPWDRKLERSLAVFGMILGLYGLCGYYVLLRDRRLVADLGRYTLLLSMSIVTVIVARWTAADPWRAELIPLLLFAMTCGIAYGRELALVFSVALTLMLAMADAHRLADSIVLLSVVATVVVQLGRIRSRRKLIQVGLVAALVAPVLTVAVGLLDNQPLIVAVGPPDHQELAFPLLNYAGYNALWTLLAGILITGFLPFVEGLFGVLTEISLLELGDVAHPLLQELVRRAPGTYNHSINVASIAEAAAEAVGARGLLVRVGAYFHDIGKMLKPDYFVENQGTENSRHDSLVPAMSTLIIIAHIKDGADLARQHHLPEPISDFIEQHHGTTLVEYFYRRASEQSEGNPDAAHVEESSFRYPGPKPQTIEAAVLMLADAAESASRVLVEPAPARLESLVEDIALKRLMDGQFDECGLTLKQLRVIEESLIKSLTAVYHGRVKYPDQRTA